MAFLNLKPFFTSKTLFPFPRLSLLVYMSHFVQQTHARTYMKDSLIAESRLTVVREHFTAN